MSVCVNCEAMGKKLEGMLTRTERIQLLTAEMVMLRSIKQGRNDHNDLMVASSCITKLLLSFDPGMRNDLIEGLQRSIGIGISIQSCPHQSLSVVT